MTIKATIGGNGQPAKFPATGTKTSGSKPKNPQTTNRQGQVTA